MKNTTMKTAMIGIGVCAILLGVLAAALLGVPVSKVGAATGKIQIEVYDGEKDQPISGATVVIPEMKQSYTTDEHGKTIEIEMPILEDSRFEQMSRKPWGEITLLCYKEGYVSYALFYAQVWENQTRQGPRVYMFSENKTSSNAPFSIIEAPHRLWVEDMLERYKPGANGGSVAATPR